MSNRHYLLVIALLLVAGVAAVAQAPVPAKPAARPDRPEPRQPLVPRAPARAEWSVRISYEFDDTWQSAPEAPEAAQALGEMRRPRSIQFSKDARLQTYRLRTRWSDGESEEEWIVMGLHVAERAGGRGLYVVGSEVTTTRDLATTDFPELAWLDMKYYRGLETHKGKPVFAFAVRFDEKPLSSDEARFMATARRADPSATPSKVFRPKVTQVTVLLDAATQLPVLYNDGHALRRYDFQPPGEPGTLRPPSRIIDFIRKRNALLEARLTPPAGPGSAE